MNDLIRQIRSFLENEHEVYGAFQVPEKSATASGLPQNRSMDRSAQASIRNHSHSGSPSTQTAANIQVHSDLSGINSLDELRVLCEHSDELRTDLSGTNLVFGVGPDRTELMLIGEAPGAKEDELKEPFVGRAGGLLNKILESVSFRRQEVYIANILKHRPPGNRDPLPEERQRSLPYLYKQIELVNPRLILCLGRVSAQTLLQTNHPMKQLRGRFHSFQQNRELLVTFHPAALLRNPAWKRDTWEDVKMLRRRFEELKQNDQ